MTSLDCLFFGPLPLSAGGMKTLPHFPEHDGDNPHARSDDGGGFVGKVAAGRSVPLTAPLWEQELGRKRASLVAMQQSDRTLGTRHSLSIILWFVPCPFQTWLPGCRPCSSLAQLGWKITSVLLLLSTPCVRLKILLVFHATTPHPFVS